MDTAHDVQDDDAALIERWGDIVDSVESEATTPQERALLCERSLMACHEQWPVLRDAQEVSGDLKELASVVLPVTLQLMASFDPAPNDNRFVPSESIPVDTLSVSGAPTPPEGFETVRHHFVISRSMWRKQVTNDWGTYNGIDGATEVLSVMKREACLGINAAARSKEEWGYKDLVGTDNTHNPEVEVWSLLHPAPPDPEDDESMMAFESRIRVHE